MTASVAGSFLTLIPVFGVALGAAFGETLSVRQWVGAAVVIAAIAWLASLQVDRDQAGNRPPAR